VYTPRQTDDRRLHTTDVFTSEYYEDRDKRELNNEVLSVKLIQPAQIHISALIDALLLSSCNACEYDVTFTTALSGGAVKRKANDYHYDTHFGITGIHPHVTHCSVLLFHFVVSENKLS
jgi:hypothetical protein